MTVIARRIKAIPERPAIDAWGIIVGLAAPTPSSARSELESVAGVASSIITDESPKDSPIVFYGTGPRVRFYCLYNEDAIAGDQANEEQLPHCATDGDWNVSLPCPKEDIDWVRVALSKKSTRITVREVGTEISETSPAEDTEQTEAAIIDTEAFNRS